MPPRTATETTADFTHGLSGYNNYKCHCRTCKDAHAAYMRDYLPAYRRGVRGGANAHIRTWARENGHHVADRGMIPRAVAAAYTAAHG